ncbi:MAG: SOS response-associated peptidase [Syntrophaceticus sp.]|nr:SOS response-associated peptidase [Syntrophaceticus sp.]
MNDVEEYNKYRLREVNMEVCGRFSLTVEIDAVAEYFHIQNVSVNYQPDHNIAPGKVIPVITGAYSKRRLSLMRWGLIPSWAKSPSLGYKMFNARAETIDEKPSFRSAFFRRRCLIPADSFYEWKRKGEPPFRIYLPDQQLFALAGIWELWQPQEESERILSCSMVTTEPNDFMRDIHNRMPVILGDEERMMAWLEGTKPAELKDLLVPYSGQMAAEPYPLHVQ